MQQPLIHVVLYAAMALAAASAWAQRSSVAQFYKGRQLTISGRLRPRRLRHLCAAVDRHMPKHIPGNPGLVVAICRARTAIKRPHICWNVAPRDGTLHRRAAEQHHG